MNILLCILVALAFFAETSYAAGEWDIHPTPLKRLENANIEPTVDAAIEVLLDVNRNSHLRATAALALAQLGDESAIQELMMATSDVDKHVRTAAISALGYLASSKDSIDLLRNILAVDVDSGSRVAAVIALYRIGTAEAASALSVAALNEMETVGTRISALTAIGDIGNQIDLDGISYLVDHESPMISAKAALVLTERGDPRYAEKVVLIALDSNTDRITYVEAVMVLEKMSGQDFDESRRNDPEMTRQSIAEWWSSEPEESKKIVDVESEL